MSYPQRGDVSDSQASIRFGELSYPQRGDVSSIARQNLSMI